MIPFFSALLGCLLFVTLLWVFGERIKNASVIDAVWSLMIAAPSAYYLFSISALTLRHVLALTMVLAWGFRLSLHIGKRLIHEKKEDKRYTQLREGWGKQHSLKMLRFFWIQAITAVFFSVPFLLIAHNDAPELKTIEIIAFVVWVVAFSGETLSDYQLSVFKRDPKNKGQACRLGLWNYSRHPNYFCEWLVWVSFFLFALGSPFGFGTIIFPVFMYHILNKVTGVPHAEKQSMSSRGESYKRYQEEVNAFFPGPPKRGQKHG